MPYGAIRRNNRRGNFMRRPHQPWEISHIRISAAATGSVQTNQALFNNNLSQGITTCKHFTFNLATTALTADQAVTWALVYVPGGTTAGTISAVNGGEIYEPQQFVVAAGSFIAPFEETEYTRIYVPMARKLHAGDALQFITRGTGVSDYAFEAVVKFAHKE